jgi:AraC-like DNA-binding protein
VLVDEPVHVWSNGEWSTQSELALVEPHLPHLVFPSRKIIEILLEVESVSCEAISARWKAMTQPEKQAATSRIHEAINLCQTDQFALEKQSFDMLFFGESVTPRALDPRISEVIDRICLMPEGPSYSVKELAFAVGLSPSRLTHFFSEQIGTTIRRFRAWKRARMAIPIALAERNLLHLALEAGYADSSHFSHSMRSFFGIRARDLCEGLRHVNVFCDPN